MSDVSAMSAWRRGRAAIAAVSLGEILVVGCGGLPGAWGASGSTSAELPAAPDGQGCNTRLAPTMGPELATAFVAPGPWWLCGTYGVGGASVVKTSADGRRVALLTNSGQVWVLDAQSFRLLGIFAHGDGPISLTALSPDGQTLATVDGPAGRVGLWSVAGRALLRQLSRPGAPSSYYGLGDVAFSHDGRTLAVVSAEHVDVFDVDAAAALPISARTDVGGAMRVAFVAGDTRLVLGRFKYWGNGPYAGWGGIDLVDAATGDHADHLDVALHINLPAIAVSGDGETLAVGATEAGASAITFIAARTGQRLGEQAARGVPLGLDRAGTRLAMLEPQPPVGAPDGGGSPARAVTVRRVSDGAVLSTVAIEASALPPGRQRLAVTPELEAVLVGDAGSRVLTRVMVASGLGAATACAAGHVSDVAALGLSGDGRVLVSTGTSTDDVPLLAWDVGTGAPLTAPAPGELRRSSAVSRDGRLLAEPVTSATTFFDLRDIASGAVVDRLGPQPTRPKTFDFAPNGTSIASASDRDPVDRRRAPLTHVWLVAGGALEQALPVITDEPEPGAQPVLFAEDGRHLFVGGFTSTALWCRSP